MTAFKSSRLKAGGERYDAEFLALLRDAEQGHAPSELRPDAGCKKYLH